MSWSQRVCERRNVTLQDQGAPAPVCPEQRIKSLSTDAPAAESDQRLCRTGRPALAQQALVQQVLVQQALQPCPPLLAKDSISPSHPNATSLSTPKLTPCRKVSRPHGQVEHSRNGTLNSHRRQHPRAASPRRLFLEMGRFLSKPLRGCHCRNISAAKQSFDIGAPRCPAKQPRRPIIRLMKSAHPYFLDTP